MNQFSMNHSVVSGDKPVGLQKEEKFIQKPIRTRFYKLLQVVNIVEVKNARAAADAKGMSNNITSVIPEAQYPIESLLRHPEAVQNVHEREKIVLVEPDGSHLQIP